MLSGVGRQVGTKHDSHKTSQHYTCHEITSHNSHTKFATFSPQNFPRKLSFVNLNLFFMFSGIMNPVSLLLLDKVVGLKHFTNQLNQTDIDRHLPLSLSVIHCLNAYISLFLANQQRLSSFGRAGL